MANLSIPTDPFLSSDLSALSLSMDPLQTMREMLRWDPFSEIYRGRPAERVAATFSPQFDLRETSDSYLLQADMPGVYEKDIDISVTSNRFMISGKRESGPEEEGETYYRAERAWGSFSRAFALSSDVDVNRVSAELRNGVLVVHLPKTGESATKHIPVHSEKGS